MADLPHSPTHRHYKGGLYTLLGEATHTETEEPMAVYMSADGRLWVRPLAMFLDEVVLESGTRVPRFAPMDQP